MKTRSFFAVIALSLAILTVGAANVTVHAQGPAGYYSKSTEKTWKGGRDTTNSYKDAGLTDREKIDASSSDVNMGTGSKSSVRARDGKSTVRAKSASPSNDHAQVLPDGGNR